MLYGFFYFFVFTFLIYLTRAKKILRIDAFVLLLILLSTVLIFLPEFIYVKDIYPAHYRANTMFKLVFQAFIMLSLCSAYIFTRLMQGRLRFVFFPVSLTLIMLVMTYPYLAIGSYYGDLKTYKGLDGMAYLKTLYPSDYDAILWLNARIKGQPVILEAQGDSYTDYGRVSSNTGLPTVLGWTVHEWLWRGDYGVPAPRIAEVKDVYETKDMTLAQKLLGKYKVKYVFIGTLEYEKYPALNEQKFEKLGKLVFQKDKTKIYEIK
jgi:YYY domain-containing protein